MASDCLFVGLFICQQDNFQMIKHTMMKLGGYLHSIKISPEFKIRGHRPHCEVPKPRILCFAESLCKIWACYTVHQKISK